MIRRASRRSFRAGGDERWLAQWKPTFLSGLVLWLRADLGITLNAGNVSAWADQSGLGHNLTQGTAASQPLWVASGPNGKPAVQFDTSGTKSLAAGFTLNQPEDVFAAMKVITQGTAGVKDIGWDGVGGANMVLGSLINNSSSISAGSGLTYAATNLAFPNYKYVECQYNGASSVINENAVPLGAPGNAGANNAGGFTLGSLNTGTRGMNNEYAEVIIYSRILTAAERAHVNAYLSARYAL